jgi:hypothetical protein
MNFHFSYKLQKQHKPFDQTKWWFDLSSKQEVREYWNEGEKEGKNLKITSIAQTTKLHFRKHPKDVTFLYMFSESSLNLSFK